MSIRIPIQTVLDYTDTGTGATSVVSKTFTIPQDADNITLKVPVASISGTAPQVDIYLQTSDDGGTTFYDQARIRLPQTVVSSTISIANASAQWFSTPVLGLGASQSSVVTGNASVRGLAANTYSGLPVMGQIGQIQIAYSGTISTNNNVQVQVKVNSQSARQ